MQWQVMSQSQVEWMVHDPQDLSVFARCPTFFSRR